jgi:hypothetical protein
MLLLISSLSYPTFYPPHSVSLHIFIVNIGWAVNLKDIILRRYCYIINYTTSGFKCSLYIIFFFTRSRKVIPSSILNTQYIFWPIGITCYLYNHNYFILTKFLNAYCCFTFYLKIVHQLLREDKMGAFLDELLCFWHSTEFWKAAL